MGGRCTQCESGKYMEASSRTCVTCHPHSHSPPASMAVSDCHCNAGDIMCDGAHSVEDNMFLLCITLIMSVFAWLGWFVSRMRLRSYLLFILCLVLMVIMIHSVWHQEANGIVGVQGVCCKRNGLYNSKSE
jgi:hypothetical protein